METINTLLYVVFVFAAIVLTVVILLQEGKGGGFGDALGTAGQQTFGVKASGIHRFTAGLCIVFLASAVAIHLINRSVGSSSVVDDSSVLDSVLNAAPADAPESE